MGVGVPLQATPKPPSRDSETTGSDRDSLLEASARQELARALPQLLGQLERSAPLGASGRQHVREHHLLAGLLIEERRREAIGVRSPA